MLSSTGNNAALYIRAVAGILALQGALLFFQAFWMMAHHHSHVPHYHNAHIHDGCHSLAYILGALLCFYTIVILLIVFTKEARSESWAVRVLGLPNLVLVLFVAFILIWLALQYEEHDEHWFTFTLEIGCGGILLFVAYFLAMFSTHGIGQLRSYGKTWIMVLGPPICGLVLLFWYENLPIHKWVSVASLVPYGAGLVTSQRGRVTKVLKKL